MRQCQMSANQCREVSDLQKKLTTVASSEVDLVKAIEKFKKNVERLELSCDVYKSEEMK